MYTYWGVTFEGKIEGRNYRKPCVSMGKYRHGPTCPDLLDHLPAESSGRKTQLTQMAHHVDTIGMVQLQPADIYDTIYKSILVLHIVYHI